MKIYQCTDGYPSCRNAEATGKFCQGQCKSDKPYLLAEKLKGELEMQIQQLPTMSVCVNTADWTNKTIQGLREIVKTQSLIIKVQDLIINGGH